MKLTAAILIIVLAILPTANGALAQDEDEEEYTRAPYRLTLTLDAGLGTASLPAAFKDLWNESLPASATIGYAIMPWIEVCGFFTYAHWGLSEIPAKSAMGFVGVQEITGGSVQTLLYGGMAKIIPLPNSRLTPFVEVGGGFFDASAKDLEVVDTGIINTMEKVSGPMFVGGLGVEYAINPTWNVYTKFSWVIGFNGDFNPEILLARGPDETTTGGNLQFGSLVMGIKLKI